MFGLRLYLEYDLELKATLMQKLRTYGAGHKLPEMRFKPKKCRSHCWCASWAASLHSNYERSSSPFLCWAARRTAQQDLAILRRDVGPICSKSSLAGTGVSQERDVFQEAPELIKPQITSNLTNEPPISNNLAITEVTLCKNQFKAVSTMSRW